MGMTEEERRQEHLDEAKRRLERDQNDPRVFLKKLWNSHAGMYPTKGTCYCGEVFTDDPDVLKNWHKTALAFAEHQMEMILQHPVFNQRIEGMIKFFEAGAWTEGFEAGAEWESDDANPDPPRNPYVGG